MKFRLLPLLAFAVVIAVPGCHRQPAAGESTSPTPSAEGIEKSRAQESSQLAAAVDAYAQVQNPENDAAVRKAMAEVDAEMAELEDLVAKRHGREREKVGIKLRRLEAYRSEQTTRFAAVQAGTALAPADPREGGTATDKPADTAQHLGSPVR